MDCIKIGKLTPICTMLQVLRPQMILGVSVLRITTFFKRMRLENELFYSGGKYETNLGEESGREREDKSETEKEREREKMRARLKKKQ